MEVEINHLFFERYKNEEIKGSDIQVNMTVERKEGIVFLHFDISGYITSICDICLENLTIPISKKEMLILKTIGIARGSDSENVVFVGEKEYLYNIEQVLYEYIVTAIPMRKVHKGIGEETCNPDMLKWIETVGKPCEPQEDERWEVLKNVKFK